MSQETKFKMSPEQTGLYFRWINERHAIYLRRAEGHPPPWTTDEVLQRFKFCNPFRENDRDTVWLRNHWTGPRENRPHGEILFNCALFRMFGGVEFAACHGWVEEDSGWDSDRTKTLAAEMLNEGRKVFTGAYIITNQGLRLPKQQVVVDLFLRPIWSNRKELAQVAAETRSLEAVHKVLGQYRGWGGGGFMAYEVVTDLMYTPVLRGAVDRYTWANAGPGAKRGLNRLTEQPLKKSWSDERANAAMRQLLDLAPEYLEPHVPLAAVDMRTIEHSLCEFDKWSRATNGEGRPRSLFKPQQEAVKGPV